MIISMRYCQSALLAGVLVFALVPTIIHAAPSIYPTGTTIYDPAKAWNGYTIFRIPNSEGDVLVDMNGIEIRRWPNTSGYPARILPGGYLIAATGNRAAHQEFMALVQWDWDGNEIWRFDKTEQVQTEDGATVWAARQHHDWQREGNPVGYYTPGADPLVDRGRTLILAHKNATVPAITDRHLKDDYILEVSWDGEVLWDWLASDHVEEFGFSDDARNAIRRAVKYNNETQDFDWLHINSATYVGPNKWYDGGDQRFHPDNVIISAREANVIAIVARSGEIVWKMGPDFRISELHLKIGQVIGQHHPEGFARCR